MAFISCFLVKQPSIFIIKKSLFSIFLNNVKHFSKINNNSKMKGLILGVYTKTSGPCNEIAELSEACKELDDKCQGKLKAALQECGAFYKSKKHKILYSIPQIGKIENAGVVFDCLSFVDLGSKEVKQDDLECRDLKLENIRRAISEGVQALTSNGHCEDIYLDSCGSPQCVAETASLTLYSYDELKQKSSQKPKSALHLFTTSNMPAEMKQQFENGLIVADCQNFARTLMESPANLMTPEIFVSTVTKKFESTQVKVIARDEDWIKEQKMGSFLSVAKGSEEKPKFLELHYNGSNSDKCIALVGKGITFDSGGISLKPSLDMDKMRADMGGAACVSATILAASRLGLKINIKGFAALCENLPSGKANKPGDVVYAMNGKSIQVDNTDAEGRLILADALCYAQKFKPVAVLDIATLTGAMCVALGASATGVYSNDQLFWQYLKKAGYRTGDRVWRMPLFSAYSKLVTDCQLADINNIGKGGRNGGACTAAAFLREFIESDQKWLHLDMAPVMENNKDDVPYTNCGMSGRPTRTLVQFMKMLAEEQAGKMF